MSDVLDTEAIATVMTDILDSIASVYEEAGVELPERQFIAMNSVVNDNCEQLSVAFQQMYMGPPGDQLETPSRCNDPRSIVLQIQLFRCIPVPQGRGNVPPTPEQMDESTRILTADCWLLMDGALSSIPAQWLGGIADVSVTDALGGYQAVQLNVVVAVP